MSRAIRRFFYASWETWCGLCHKKIHEGDKACYDDDKNIVHFDCMEDEEE